MGDFRGNFYSSSLKMTTQIDVIFPDRSNDVDPIVEGVPRTLFLLHGLSGNSDEWLRFSKIEYYAKKYNFTIILPEAARSFYCDTVYGMDYFGYIADELPEICGRWFNIDLSKENTFIAGESMGGYGAVKIGLSRPERFAGIASLSGVLDLEAFSERVRDGSWPDMKAEELDVLKSGESLTDLAKRIADDENRPKLIQLCGTEDFLYEDNQRFRRTLEEMDYGHAYLEGPGDHEWPYWDKAIQHAFMYFLGLDLKKTRLY